MPLVDTVPGVGKTVRSLVNTCEELIITLNKALLLSQCFD